jgi:hypothetical protein
MVKEKTQVKENNGAVPGNVAKLMTWYTSLRQQDCRIWVQ